MRVVVFIIICSLACVAEEPKPETGERLLGRDETDKVLDELAKMFKAHPYVSAKIQTEVEDLVGKRTEEGELLLARPSRMLRKFTKPSVKAWLLDGAQISEFVPAQKSIFVKDLTGAPKALKQIQSALTGDIKALEAFFTVTVFSKPGEKDATAFRIVLGKKPGASRHLHRTIQARITQGGLFFDEIHYVPDEGDEVIERFREIKEVAKPADTDFAIRAPEGTIRKVDRIEE